MRRGSLASGAGGFESTRLRARASFDAEIDARISHMPAKEPSPITSKARCFVPSRERFSRDFCVWEEILGNG